MSMFKVDDRELKKLGKDLKIKRKSQIRAVQRTVLNSEAFATRKEAIRQGGPIDDALTIRNKFAKSSILVDMATNKKMQSEVGSKFKWKRNPSKPFWGLGDAEEGATLKNPGIITPLARISGMAGKTVGKKNRDLLKKPIPINSSDPIQQIRQIAALEQNAPQYFFRIKHGRRGMKKGIYKFISKKDKWKDGSKHKQIRMVTDESKTSVREKKRPWLRPSAKKAVTKQSVMRMYREAFIKFVKK